MQKGQKHTEEFRKRLSELALQRPPVSEATRQKMSESARKRKPHSQETKDKIRATLKAHYAKQEDSQ